MMSRRVRSDSTPDVDGGWAWVVLGATFVSFGILWGQAYVFSIDFVVFLQAFGESRSYTAWIGSLNLAVLQLSAISVGFFISRLGDRGTTLLGSGIAVLGYVATSFCTSVAHLLVAYGVVVAFGSSLCVYGCLESLSRHFCRRLYPAAGIAISGGGVGMMVTTYLNRWLIDEYGWRGAMLIRGGLALQLAVTGSTFYRVAPPKTASTGVIAAPMTWKRRVADARVALLAVACALQGFGVFTMYVVFEDLAIAAGFESVFAATVTAVGVGNVLGRGTSGIVVDRWSPLLFYAAATSACAAVMFAHVFNPVPEAFVALGFILGFAHGGVGTVLPLVVAFVFGRREMATTFGYLVSWSGLGTLIGPPLTGFMTDRTGSYLSCLLVSGTALILAVVLVVVVHRLHEWRVDRSSEANGVIEHR